MWEACQKRTYWPVITGRNQLKLLNILCFWYLMILSFVLFRFKLCLCDCAAACLGQDTQKRLISMRLHSWLNKGQIKNMCAEASLLYLLLPLTTERSRVTLGLLFSQNKHTSRISAGRVLLAQHLFVKPKMIEESICNLSESRQWLIINNSASLHIVSAVLDLVKSRIKLTSIFRWVHSLQQAWEVSNILLHSIRQILYQQIISK